MKQLILLGFLALSINTFSQIKGFEEYVKKPRLENFYIGEKVRIKEGDTLNFEYAEPSVYEGFEVVWEETMRVLEVLEHPVDSIFYSVPEGDSAELFLNDPEELFDQYSDPGDVFMINWIIRDPKNPKRKFIRLILWMDEDLVFMRCLRVKWSDFDKWMEENE